MSFSCGRCENRIPIGTFSLEAVCSRCGHQQLMRSVPQVPQQPQQQQPNVTVNVTVITGKPEPQPHQPPQHHNYIHGLDSHWPETRNPLCDGRRNAIERYVVPQEPQIVLTGLGNWNHQMYAQSTTSYPLQRVSVVPTLPTLSALGIPFVTGTGPTFFHF
jgi:DNA-directed RNA polymerase subunit RPC12/RpoP